MNIEKPTRYVVFGAGAIGGPIAGLLARAGSRVVCVARSAIAEALSRGITINEGDKQLTVPAECVTAAREISPESGDLVMITTKSQATESAVKQLLEVYGENLSIVCLQNGARNEEIAARSFRTVYAG